MGKKNLVVEIIIINLNNRTAVKALLYYILVGDAAARRGGGLPWFVGEGRLRVMLVSTSAGFP